MVRSYAATITLTMSLAALSIAAIAGYFCYADYWSFNAALVFDLRHGSPWSYLIVAVPCAWTLMALRKARARCTAAGAGG